MQLTKIIYIQSNDFYYSFECYFLLPTQMLYNTTFFWSSKNKLSFFLIYLLWFFIMQRQFVVQIGCFVSLNMKPQTLTSYFNNFFFSDVCHKESLLFLKVINSVFKVKKKELDVQTTDKI